MTQKTDHISLEELSAFIDSDLTADRVALVEAHLAECDMCQSEVEQIRAMRGGLKLLAAVELQKDLWPQIQQESSKKPTGGLADWFKKFWMVPTAALVGAAVALMVMVLAAGPTVKEVKAPQGPQSALASVQKAEIEYRNAIGALEAALTKDSPDWSPEVQKVIRDSLLEIDHSIKKCRLALKNSPDNRIAQESVLTAYQYKVDLLTELVAQTL
ncbi:MAG: zf-HC2 domain-containing protein [Deltaproteobacteria bacterium]|nr:zf-HC2 domain-containing protein [Deltaproteobacteria bacterium]